MTLRRSKAILPALALALAACGRVDSAVSPAGPSCDAEPPVAGNAGPWTGDLASRPLPTWYDDAKLGIMIHWGPFAVPAWAERTLDPEVIFTDPSSPDYFLTPQGVERFLRANPYSEWYRNSMSIEGSGTWAHHRETWGADYPYERFGETFGAGLASWKPGDWSDLFRRAGARYVVLVTKHHDGYQLWPSDVPHAGREDWHAPRDVVGELSRAVRGDCMRMGFYYSGGIDWTFAPPPFATVFDALRLTPQGPEYAGFVDAQWRELVDRYRPSVLWNDIDAPPGSAPESLFRDYYGIVPDGVVNDRWDGAKVGLHHDFTTSEFTVEPAVREAKWEHVRGMARGFGYNRNDRPEDYGAPGKFVRLLVDVVSKNGNLLLNVGPRADGSIPDEQRAILEELGAWLAVNGEAIYGSRPWTRFEGETTDGLPVRFTRNAAGDRVFAIVLGEPRADSVAIPALDFAPARVRLPADGGREAAFRFESGTLTVDLPAGLPSSSALVLALDRRS
ncbi:MAG: alpha-L-fucosidase [Alphaproteobacteria bacterium]